MKIVNIPGVGRVKFPDEMSDEDIDRAVNEQAIRARVTDPGAPKTEPTGMERTLIDKIKGGAKDFGKGYAETGLPSTTPKDYLEGPLDVIRHPAEDLGMLRDATMNAHQGEFEKAYQGLDKAKAEGRIFTNMEDLETIGHGLAGWLPFVGPAAAMTGETLGTGAGEGGVRGAMRGAGQATGLLLDPLTMMKGLKGNKAKVKAPEVPASVPKAVEKPIGTLDNIPVTAENIDQVKAEIQARKAAESQARVLKRQANERAKMQPGDMDPAELDAANQADIEKYNKREGAYADVPREVQPPRPARTATLKDGAPRLREVPPEVYPEAVAEGGYAGSVDKMPGRAARVETRPPTAKPEVPTVRSFKFLGPAASKKLAEIVETSIPGTGKFQEFRQRQAKALNEFADATVKDISEFDGTGQELGAKVQGAIDEAKTAAKDAGSRQYEAAIGDLREKPIDVSQSVKQAQAALKRPGVDNSNVGTALREFITKAKKGRLTVQEVQDFRSYVKEATRGKAGDKILTGTAVREGSDLAQALTRDLLNGGEKHRPGFAKDLNQADAAWKGIYDEFDKTVLDRMLKADPEKVHYLLRGASAEDIARVRKAVPVQEFQAMKARILRDILDTSTKPTSVSSVLPEQVAGVDVPMAKEPRLSPQTLSTELGKLKKDGKLELLYSPEEIKGLMGLAGQVDKAGVPAHNVLGTFANAIIFGQTGRALMSGDIGGLMGPAMMATTLHVMSRVMTRPGGASAFAKYLEAINKNVPNARTSTEAKYWAVQLGNMYKQEAEREKRRSPRKTTGQIPGQIPGQASSSGSTSSSSTTD